MEVPSGVTMLLKSMGVKFDPVILQQGVDMLDPEKIKAFLSDVTAKVTEARDTLVRIESKLDDMRKDVDLNDKEIDEDVIEVENRIKEFTPSLASNDDPKANEG